jgi:hypothetical protein
MEPANCNSRVDLPIDLVEPRRAAKNSALTRKNARLGALFFVDESRRDVAAAEILGKRAGDDVSDIGGFCYSGPRA